MWISGKNRNGYEPKDRHIAMVFQHYALYPHMNVYDNMAFGLRVGKRLPEPEIESRVKEAAAMLQLESLLQRKPKELSAANGNAWRSAAPSCASRAYSCSMSRSPTSMLTCVTRCGSKSASSSSASA